MDKRKLENPLSRLMGLVGKQKKKYALSIVLAILGVAAGYLLKVLSLYYSYVPPVGLFERLWQK